MQTILLFNIARWRHQRWRHRMDSPPYPPAHFFLTNVATGLDENRKAFTKASQSAAL